MSKRVYSAENKYIAIQELYQNEEFPIVIHCDIAGINTLKSPFPITSQKKF